MTDQIASGTYADPNAVGWAGWVESPNWIVFVAPNGDTLKLAKVAGESGPSVIPVEGGR
jgi:hypothetical protein